MILLRVFVACLVTWSALFCTHTPDTIHSGRTSSFFFVLAAEKQAMQDLQWVQDEGCSRLSSRLVRSFLVKDVFPRLPFPPEALPEACQLNPRFDRYRFQEGNKTEVTRGDFQCKLCGKHFRTEFYLDKHMHNKHQNILQGGDHGICLGDLCPIFGCSSQDDSNFHINYRAGKTNRGPRELLDENKFFQLDESCTTASLEKQQFLCDAMIRKCFSGLVDTSLQKQFKKNICGELECINGLLKGSIVQRGLSANMYMKGDAARIRSENWSEGDDDQTLSNEDMSARSTSMAFWMLRMLIAAGVLLFVGGYAYFAGMSLPWKKVQTNTAPRSTRFVKPASNQPVVQPVPASPVGVSTASSNASLRTRWYSGKDGAKGVNQPRSRDSDI